MIRSAEDRLHLLNVFLTALFFVADFLHRNSYGFWRAESLLLYGAVSGGFLALYLACRAARQVWLFYAAALLLAADATPAASLLYLQGRSWTGSRIGGCALLAGCALLPVAAAFLLRRKAARIYLAGIAAALAASIGLAFFQPDELYRSSSMEGAGAAAPAPRADAPNIFILILDEHAGLEGFPEAGAPAAQLQEAWRESSRQGGFRLYGKAFSNYSDTLDSIPSLLNARIFSRRNQSVEGNRLTENRLFARLASQGYALQVYQSNFLDYCRSGSAGVRRCFECKSSSMGYLEPLPGGALAKLKILLPAYLLGYQKATARIAGYLAPGLSEDLVLSTGALAIDRVLEEIRLDAARFPSGTVFFAHLFMPHYSYVFDAGCGIRGMEAWENRLERTGEEGRENTPSTRDRKARLYIEQAACLQRRIGAFLDELRRLGRYESSTIVLLGDHGSRLFLTRPHESFQDRMARSDYLAAFSCFLAIKNGGYNPSWPVNRWEEVPGREPAASILAEFFGLLPEAESRAEIFRRVHLDGADHTLFKETEMIDF